MLALLVGVLALPFAMRSEQGSGDRPANERTLIVVTPHVQQIQVEFAEGFRRWHTHHYPDEPPVGVDFRHPGGTSEIIKQLQAEFGAAIKSGRIDPKTGRADPGTISFDLMFGGGTYDHGRLAEGVSVAVEGEPVTVPMSVPAGFDRDQLAAWFGVGEGGEVRDSIGGGRLFHPDQHWIGTALSGFGIVYNRRLLDELGRGEPTSVEDMIDPELMGWVALCDPRQSGSITTNFDSILNNYGWARGWHILRALSANTRYFTDRSTKPPIDVAQGEAALGLAIDFYGRAQAQAVMRPGETPRTSRVGYIDPPAKVFIDADPISILRGGPHPRLARRFIRFVNSELGQSLWQFHARSSPASEENPVWLDGEPMGPRGHALRRMPVRRSMYARHADHFVDRVDPYAAASGVAYRGWRSSIKPMMASFGIDPRTEIRQAWRAIARLRQRNPEGAAALDEAVRRFDLLADAEFRRASEAGGPQSDRAPADSSDRESWAWARFYERGVVGGYEWAEASAIPRAWPDELARAHAALVAARERAPRIFACERIFYRMPRGEEVERLWNELFPEARDAGGELARPEAAFQNFTPATYRAIRGTWREESVAVRLRIIYTRLFKDNYREVVALAEADSLAARSSDP